MTYKRMEWVDRLLGIPLCLLASLFSLVIRMCGSSGSIQTPEEPSILVIKLLGMGSILLTTPTIKSLKKRFPQARIDLVTFKNNCPLADNLGIFFTTHTIRNDNFFCLTYDTLLFLSRCWHRRYDLVLDFEFFSRFSMLLSFLSGAPRRVGFSSPLVWRGWLLTDKVPFNHYRHMVDNFLSQARIFGGDTMDRTLASLQSGALETETTRALLSAKAVPLDAKVILVNVNASDMCLERRWPASYYQVLFDHLRQDFPQQWFVFIGAEQERPYVAEVLLQLGPQNHLVDLSGQLTLSQLAALMKRSQLLITSESGPLHFAQSVGLPTVSLFGPGPPAMFAPEGPQNRTLYAAVECSPCLNYYALSGPTCHGDNICMKTIQPIQVERAIKDLLGTFYPSL